MKISDYMHVADDRLINSLSPVVRVMSEIESSGDSEILLDFSDTASVSPLCILSLFVFTARCGKTITISGGNPYFDAIGLSSGGIRPDKFRRSEFMALMEGYSRKSYIPIINFPARTNSDDKESISSVVEDIIIRQVGIEHNVATGIKYMVEETIDNVTEHSNTDRGYVFAQAYPDRGYLDICIADCGITLLGSYQKLPDNEIADDMEAMRAANRGISSKNRPEAENRGFGIYTSKKMLIEGLGGEYLMISGNSMYIKNDRMDGFYSMPEGIRWNGTIVAFRIPYQSPDFNYVKYIE